MGKGVGKGVGREGGSARACGERARDAHQQHGSISLELRTRSVLKYPTTCFPCTSLPLHPSLDVARSPPSSSASTSSPPPLPPHTAPPACPSDAAGEAPRELACTRRTGTCLSTSAYASAALVFVVGWHGGGRKRGGRHVKVEDGQGARHRPFPRPNVLGN